jgi:pSer/pThr/pTyr-binding forkhead associated (FHA) protein
MAKLMLNLGSAILNEIILVKETTTIGRSGDNDIILDNLSASGHHARVVKRNDQYVLEDLASTNGTLINSKKVTSKALEDDDIIAIGKHELRFIGDASEREEQPSDFEKTVFVRMPSAQATPAVTPQSPPTVVNRHPTPMTIPDDKSGGMVKIVAGIVVLLVVAVVAYLMLKI